jgi:hypothetical protein
MTLSLVALLLAQSAEETYRALEKKIATAPAVTLKYAGEAVLTRDDRTVESKVRGTIQVKPGNKVLYDLELVQDGNTMTQVSRSDGKTTVLTANGRKGQAVPVQEGATELLRESVLRVGFIALTIAIHFSGMDERKALPSPDETVVLSEFASPEKDVLTYKVRILDTLEGTMTLRLKDGLPVKREFTSAHEGVTIRVVETYEKCSLEDLPDRLFAHE